MSTNKLMQTMLGMVAGWMTVSVLAELSMTGETQTSLMSGAIVLGILVGQFLTKDFAVAMSSLVPKESGESIGVNLLYANLFLFSAAAPGAMWKMTDIFPISAILLVSITAAWTTYNVVYKSGEIFAEA